MITLTRAAPFAALLVLAACSHAPAPVEESLVVKKNPGGKIAAAQPATPVAVSGGQQYKVEKGETLYSIAFRYGMDFKTLAALNGIRDPYTIHPGQLLLIKSRGQPITPRAKPGAVPVTGKADAGKTDIQKPAVKPLEATKAVAATKPVAVEPAVAAAAPPKPAAVSPAKAAPVPVPGITLSAPVSGRTVVTRVVGGGSWQWPVPGALIGNFSSAGVGPKGIAIAGSSGDPVRAARDGRVVYTGSSLVGYGQLVIIKHDDVYLSAYAHNSRVLVKEGDQVKAGSVIAEMGSSGADRTKLHFEVRRNGDPINPLSVLPPI